MSVDEQGHLAIWPHVTDDTRVPRQSWGQVDVHSSQTGQVLEQDGWPVLSECTMDEHQR